jgi:FkbM family methyltransferase
VTRMFRLLNTAPCWRSTWRVYGMRFFGPTLDRVIYLVLHKYGFVGRREKALIETLVTPGQQVLDVGGNIGLYTALMARCVGNQGRVGAFEPVPMLAGALRCAIDWNALSQVELHPVALGETDGTVKMCVRPFNSGDNRIHRTGDVEVPMRRGDSLLSGWRVDFIKMDVQGYELPVLRGLSKTIAGSDQLKILFEYWPAGIQRAGFCPLDFTSCLESSGFDLMRLGASGCQDRIRWSEIDLHLSKRPWGDCGNFVAVRPFV